jgi:hypothetical protein
MLRRRLRPATSTYEIAAKSPQTVRALPAEERADDEALPGFECEGLIGPFAGRMVEMPEEADGA